MQVLRVTDALPWEAFWLIFSLSLVVVNGAVTIGVQGATLFKALGNTDTKELLLVCLCFLVWGVGATGASIAVLCSLLRPEIVENAFIPLPTAASG